MLRTFTFYLLLSCQLFVSSIVHAAYFSPEPTATDAADGNYTLLWKKHSGDIGVFRLYETLPSGNRTKIYEGVALSKSFSGKANGTYKYEIFALKEDFSNPFEPDVRWFRTDILTLVVNKTPIPPTPSSITVPTSTVTNSAITISWTASSTAFKYELQESVNYGAWTTLTNNTTLTNYSRTGLNNGSYKYRVRAYNSSGWSGFRVSSLVSVNIQNTKGKQVIYIHTDLLGSLVAETDVNGDVQ